MPRSSVVTLTNPSFSSAFIAVVRFCLSFSQRGDCDAKSTSNSVDGALTSVDGALLIVAALDGNRSGPPVSTAALQPTTAMILRRGLRLVFGGGGSFQLQVTVRKAVTNRQQTHTRIESDKGKLVARCVYLYTSIILLYRTHLDILL